MEREETIKIKIDIDRDTCGKCRFRKYEYCSWGQYDCILFGITCLEMLDDSRDTWRCKECLNKFKD
jgi:hypothetical protein